MIVSGGVDNDLGFGLCDSLLHARSIADVEGLTIKGANGPCAPLKFAAQFYAELAASTEDDDLTLHPFAE